MPPVQNLNLWAAIPALSLAIGACVLFLIDAFIPRERKGITAWLAVIGVLVSLVLSLPGFSIRTTAFSGMFLSDSFSALTNIVALMTALISILVAYDYLKRTNIERGEYYPLLLMSVAGAMFMGAAGDLVVVFVGLELLSIPLYILAGFRRPDPRSEESAMKYFLLGAFSTGFLVYGIALVFGATGTTNLQLIFDRVNASALTSPFLLLMGAGLLIVGLGFKVAAVPFHMWTPDVYQGAPTPVTAFMSVIAKVGGFGAMLRVLVIAIPTLLVGKGQIEAGMHYAAWQSTIALIAALTMILGNFVAILQRDVKRLLAYSSIAHAGYILMAVAAAGTFVVNKDAAGNQTVTLDIAQQAVQGALIYLLAYTFTNIGAFAVLTAVERNDGTGTTLDDLSGLGKNHPLLAGAMAIFMLSLTGIPLTAGFVGKWFVFASALNAGLGVLAVIGVLTSVVSAYYYLRVIVKLWLENGEGQATSRPPLTAAIAICVVGTLVLGILPYLASNLVQSVTTVALK